MKLYKEVLIESAEQAEALPDGTLAHRALKLESTWDTVEQPEVAVKAGINAWRSTAVDDDAWDWLDRHLVGWTSLVPIEAEEEWEDDGRPVWNIGEGEVTPADVDDYERRNGRRPSRRLVTPWEEA